MKKTSLLLTALLFCFQEANSLDFKKIVKTGTATAAFLGSAYYLMRLLKTNSTPSTNQKNPKQSCDQPSKSIINQPDIKPVAQNEKAKIYQVLQQHDLKTSCWWQDDFWAKIYQQAESTNCGYHALKNAILILEQPPSFLHDIASVDYYKQIARPWIEEIQRKNIQNNSGYPLGNMITGSDIDYLINTFAPNLAPHISVIDSFEIFDDPTKSSDIQIALLKRLSQEKNMHHAFIVNTDALKKAGLCQGFHWCVYFLEKSPEQGIRISFLDSLTTINPMITEKVRGLCLSKTELENKIAKFEEATKVAPILMRIETIKKNISSENHYVMQKHAIKKASLGLLDLKDLNFCDNTTTRDFQQIEKAFQESIPSFIQKLRATRNVLIDGVLNEPLTQIRSREIEALASSKLRLFTLWKKKSTDATWHMHIDTISSEQEAQTLIARYRNQYGIKHDTDRDLRRYDISNQHEASDSIESIFALMNQTLSHPWSSDSIKKIISTCATITDHGICNNNLERYRRNMAPYLRKIQQEIARKNCADKELYQTHHALKNWTDSKNGLALEICKQIEQLKPNNATLQIE